jgi:hypothetical protein
VPDGGFLSEQRINDIQAVSRYELWYAPHFPIQLPWVRSRDAADSWRLNLLESIREEGLRHPITIHGHSPKGLPIEKYITDENRDTPRDFIVRQGTNRLWCCRELGWETIPAIVSINKGSTLPEGVNGGIIPHEKFLEWVPGNAVRVWVREHDFGYKQPEEYLPENEFA